MEERIVVRIQTKVLSNWIRPFVSHQVLARQLANLSKKPLIGAVAFYKLADKNV